MKIDLKLEGNNLIEELEDGSFNWIPNAGETENFADASDLLNHAEEYEPGYYAEILAWIEG